MCISRINFASMQIEAKTATGVWLLLLAALNGTVFATVSTFNSADVPKAIPNESTVESTTTVSGAGGLIEDINVKLNITHAWDADLSVYLIGPPGTMVELFGGLGGSGNNFTDTVLDDRAATPITSGAPPFRGSFRPQSSLSAFDGLVLGGVWTLRVTDRALGDTGTLNSWSITIRTANPPAISRVFPRSAANSGRTYFAILEGTDLQAGATVKLTKASQADIAAAGAQVVNSGRLTCRLNLAGAVEGLWSVEVTNPDGQSAVLADAVEVWSSQPYLNAMGANSCGQLGIGTNTWSPHPALIDGVVEVAAGLNSTLVLREDGTVWECQFWAPPHRVADLAGVVAITVGEAHCLVLKSNGTVWAWGRNDAGQLGDGTTTYRETPVQVPGVAQVVAIAAGSYQSIAVQSDGTVWAWGWNAYGQLGDGTTTVRHWFLSILIATATWMTQTWPLSMLVRQVPPYSDCLPAVPPSVLQLLMPITTATWTRWISARASGATVERTDPGTPTVRLEYNRWFKETKGDEVLQLPGSRVGIPAFALFARVMASSPPETPNELPRSMTC